MQILSVYHEDFKKYGKVLEGYDVDGAVAALRQAQCPKDAVVYIPSEESLEKLDVFAQLCKRGFGGLPAQFGFCNGYNKRLNAVEYHRSSEINIAATELVLLLGLQQDIEPGFRYDTSKIQAFLLPAGTAVECYATTLHYAPCCAPGQSEFRCGVVLPKGTNLPYPRESEPKDDDILLTAANKWLIAHEEAGISGAFTGLYGDNLKV